MFLKLSRLSLFVALAVICGACSVVTGYSRLEMDERESYRVMADRMTLEERTAYLAKESRADRDAYLKELAARPVEEPKAPVTTAAAAFSSNQVFANAEPRVQSVTVTDLPAEPSVAKKTEKPASEAALAPLAPVAKEQKSDSPPKVAETKPEPPAALTVKETAAPLKAKEAPSAPQVKAEVPAPKPVLRSTLNYPRTNDPVVDVLTLLDLYDKGRISKEDFEREKEIALQRVP